MIAIVDYGAGNLRSVELALARLGVHTRVTADPDMLALADGLILPGVGAFSDAMAALGRSGTIPAVLEAVGAGRPLLGICLGMQLLFDRSSEYGDHPGLGLVPGEVTDLRADLEDPALKVPHMGWNSLHVLRDDPLFRYFRDGEYVYYVHSFYAHNCAASTLAVSQYGNVAVTGVVRSGNVWGTQFHPEKSGDAGLRLLKAFGEL